jgi:hypothetical protein
MTVKYRFLCGLALACVLTAGLACSRADSSFELKASESLEAAPLPLAGAADVGADLGPADNDGLGAFPAFMPPLAAGTETQECQLGTDPYSTCI